LPLKSSLFHARMARGKTATSSAPVMTNKGLLDGAKGVSGPNPPQPPARFRLYQKLSFASAQHEPVAPSRVTADTARKEPRQKESPWDVECVRGIELARLNWSRQLPRPLSIPGVMRLRTLADIRRLIDHLPADCRDRDTWRHVADRLHHAAPYPVSLPPLHLRDRLRDNAPRQHRFNSL
jgi:hypothetical protein